MGCPQNADRRERDERLAATANPPVNDETEKSKTTELNLRESLTTTRIPDPPPTRVVAPVNHLPASNVTTSNRFAVLTKTANIPRIDDMDENDDSEEESSDIHDSDPLSLIGDDDDSESDGNGNGNEEPGNDDAATDRRAMHHMIVDPSQSQTRLFLRPPQMRSSRPSPWRFPPYPLKRPHEPTMTPGIPDSPPSAKKEKTKQLIDVAT